MSVIGIDPAGMPKNDTGIAIFENKNVRTCLVHEDDEIVEVVEKERPELVAIDAPFSKPKQGSFREADLALRKYGTLPLNMRGMVSLTERGIKLKEKLGGFGLIEVFPKATALILGYYDEDGRRMQKNMLAFGITGEPEKRLLSKDEIDAISAAITGYLHLQGKTKEVGDEEGRIVIPEV